MKPLSHVRLFETLWTEPTRLLRPWNFPGKNTGVGCHFLLQGIFSWIGPESPELQASALPSEPPGKQKSVKKRVVKEDEKKKRHVHSSRAESQ